MFNPQLNKYFLSPEHSIQDAIECLDKVDVKLIVIVSTNHTLLGTVTDGDIRRALLKHLSINTPLSEVMNCSPKYLVEGDSEIKAIQLKKLFGIPAIPKLDQNNHVVDLMGIKKGIERRDNTVFIMAGGFGKRLKPLTNNCPKPMLLVGDKPILENIIEKFITSGFYNFYISTHYLNEQIESYFGDGSQFGINIDYVREDFPLGTAGALALLPDEATKQPIIMMNGDLLTQVKFDEFLDYHMDNQADISMAVRDYEVQVPYGVIEHSGNLITKITEKPKNTYFINAGIYCISPRVLNEIEVNKPLDMPDLIDKQFKLHRDVSMFPIHEYWLDIGKMDDFKQAQCDILKFKSIA
jgi:dTDP-glucose pyrophosphorylase